MYYEKIDSMLIDVVRLWSRMQPRSYDVTRMELVTRRESGEMRSWSSVDSLG